LQAAQKEIELLIDSDEHPALIRYYAKAVTEEFIYLVLSYCPQTLVDFVTAQQEKEREQQLKEKEKLSQQPTVIIPTTAPTSLKTSDSNGKWMSQTKPGRKNNATPDSSANWRSNSKPSSIANNTNNSSKQQSENVVSTAVENIEYAPVINLFFAKKGANSSPKSDDGNESEDFNEALREDERRGDQLKRIIYDLAQGLQHLHSLGIIHRYRFDYLFVNYSSSSYFSPFLVLC
jgi:hypothetical protein